MIRYTCYSFFFEFQIMKVWWWRNRLNWMQVGYFLLVGHKRFLYFFYPIPILHYINNFCVTKGPVWLNELGSWIIYTTHTSLSPIRRGIAPSFVNYKKGALDSQSQVIKFTSCLPGSVVLSGYSGFLHHYKWSPWYSWNIAESGVKHKNFN